MTWPGNMSSQAEIILDIWKTSSTCILRGSSSRKRNIFLNSVGTEVLIVTFLRGPFRWDILHPTRPYILPQVSVLVFVVCCCIPAIFLVRERFRLVRNRTIYSSCWQLPPHRFVPGTVYSYLLLRYLSYCNGTWDWSHNLWRVTHPSIRKLNYLLRIPPLGTIDPSSWR